jgi:hypothetical protein
MAIPLLVAGAIAAGTAIAGGKQKNNARKALDKTIRNRPKYEIADEAYENQNLARSEAFGRDRAIQTQQENLDLGAENAVSQAKDVTSSTSGLLSTIASIQANKDAAGRQLAIDEASLDKTKQLIMANNMMIDEKDKAWNFNKNMPYQNKLAMYRMKQREGSELMRMGLSMGFNTAMGAGGGGGGAAQ